MDSKALFLTGLIEKTRETLNVFARSRIRDKSAADDLVQDACLTAWNRIDVVIASPNPDGWMLNTLKNLLLRYYRTQKERDNRTAELPEETRDNESAEEMEDGEISFAHILTDEENRIIQLREQGYKDNEIAGFLKKSPDAVRKILQRIRIKIRKHQAE